MDGGYRKDLELTKVIEDKRSWNTHPLEEHLYHSIYCSGNTTEEKAERKSVLEAWRIARKLSSR